MALLNYANSITDIEDFLSASQGNTNYLKLVFTNDGHIVTHGIDYTPDFTVSTNANGGRGLVKGSTNNPKEFLRGTNSWSQLVVADLPYATDLNTSNDDTIPTTKAVVDYIGSFVKTAETMRFMGVISWNGVDFQTTPRGGTTHQGLPENWVTGDTYRIGVVNNDEGSITLVGELVQPGDMLICINNGGGTMQHADTDWSVIQTNINGTKTTTFNGISTEFYAKDSNPIIFYAPTEQGNFGEVLISNGGQEPKWGKIDISPTGLLNISYSENNTDITVTTLTIVANKIQKQLYPGIGVTFTTEGVGASYYDGTESLKIDLLPATIETLGAVKIDTWHGTTPSGEQGPTISVDTDGTIYLTNTNIVNALGYNPSTMYDVVSTTKEGYAPIIDLNGSELSFSYKVLAANESGVPNWHSLPLTAFKDSWRDIRVRNLSIDNGWSEDNGYPKPTVLNFVPSENIYVRAETGERNNEHYADLSFGLTWFDITNQVYEIME